MSLRIDRSPDSRGEQLAEHIADRLSARTETVVERWLRRLLLTLPERPHQVFPQRTLLDHMPPLIARVAQALRGDEQDSDLEGTAEHMAALAELRHSQGYGLDQLQRDCALLGDVLFEWLGEEVEALTEPVTAVGLLRVADNLRRALAAISRSCTRVYREQVLGDMDDQQQTLHRIGRKAVHDVRNRMNALQLHMAVLEREGTLQRTDSQGGRPATNLRAELSAVDEAVDDMFALMILQSRTEYERGGFPTLATLFRRVGEGLAEFARLRNVAVRVAEDVPELHVDAARVQLALVVLVRNAVKYSDPAKPERWVAVEAEPDGDERVRIRVRDNGLGIPAEHRERVFRRNLDEAGEDGPEDDREGVGLELALRAVRELGSDIHLESHMDEGSAFSFSLPLR